jgi:NAD(P)-dependent dehydrogenase (short-subunit alcohol dehydrogenase family)
MNTPRTAIVTGASRGIGACLVKTLLGRGYPVVGTSSTNHALQTARSKPSTIKCVRSWTRICSRAGGGDWHDLCCHCFRHRLSAGRLSPRKCSRWAPPAQTRWLVSQTDGDL